MNAAHALSFADLPDVIPVFPLSGVLLLPQGMLPLNIFEPRYLAMVDDALKAQRLIGMIQPKDPSDNRSGVAPMQRIGCAGRIVQFSETGDGRYLITLQGCWRFSIEEELPQGASYRRARVSWKDYEQDLNGPQSLDLDREKLRDLARAYFAQHELHVDCKQLEGASDAKIINALSMICPFDALDKQALLEAPDPQARAKMFMAMLEIAAHEKTCESCH